MKKLLLSSLAVAALSLASLSASAATATGNFNVSVTLSPLCKATSALQTLAFGTYMAIDSSALSATGTVTFDCTRGLADPVVSFDAEPTSNTTYGVLAGLNYRVVAGTASTSNGAAAAATSTGQGSAKTYSYLLTGTMPAGQAGDCAGATATVCAATMPLTSATRTLTLTY